MDPGLNPGVDPDSGPETEAPTPSVSTESAVTAVGARKCLQFGPSWQAALRESAQRAGLERVQLKRAAASGACTPHVKPGNASRALT